jgi:hypothetical protein
MLKALFFFLTMDFGSDNYFEINNDLISSVCYMRARSHPCPLSMDPIVEWGSRSFIYSDHLYHEHTKVLHIKMFQSAKTKIQKVFNGRCDTRYYC